MAKKVQVSLSDAWYQEALKLVAGDVNQVANAVADSITEAKTTVTPKIDRNGRPVALVAIAEARGIAMQAKHGTLTRAAARQGLDVTRYDGGR